MTADDVVSLKEYFDMRFKNLDEALRIANENLAIRLEHLNEWKETTKNRDATFLTNDVYQTYEKIVEKRLRELEDAKTVMDSKASQRTVNIALFFSITDLIVSVIWIISNIHK